MVQKKSAKVWILALTMVASRAHAQITPPDAGALIQQVPRPGLLPSPRPVQPTEVAPQPAVRAPGPKVRVLSFQVQGNSLLSQEQLAPTLAPYLHQSLDLGQLEQVAQALAQRYREDGWVVSAYLPAQDVTQGNVLIQIEEAKLGNLRLSAPEGLRGSQERAQRYFDALLSTGQALNVDALDRAQLLANELLGLDVVTNFKKGQRVGTTDVDVRLRVQLNLFHAEHESHAPPVWHRFRRWVEDTYRDYLLGAHGVRNARDLRIEARCIPVHYQPGMRAQPHYHH